MDRAVRAFRVAASAERHRIFVRSTGVAKALDDAAYALKLLVAEEGLVPVDGERWDREITLTPGRDWLVVEGLAGRVGRGPAALSLKLETVALGTILSLDLLELSLCQYGRVIDVYASDPSLLVGLSATKRKEHAGHPQRWKPFLQLPNAPRDLRAAWLGAATLTDKLASTASMLGVERPQLDAQGTAARRLRYAQREEPL